MKKKIAEINVQLDELRRKENPQNYTDDGQIKRGIKLIWNKSKKYKKIQNKLADLQRKRKINLKISHNKLANFVLTLGDNFKIENNPVSAWTKRASGIRKKSDGKIQSNKRHGKSVGNHAPSMFVTILENKIKSLGGVMVKLPIKNASTRFDFTNGVFTEHKEDERQITLSDGITHDRDIISAFNIQHCLGYTKDEEKKYDIEGMKRDYKHFCEMEFIEKK